MSTTPVDLGQPVGPRRWGWMFAAIWLFYLLTPLEAGWEKRDTLDGWIGMLATLAFGAVYLGTFLLLRFRRPPGTPFRATPSTAFGLGILATEISLGVIICLSVGQPGSATAVYITVLSMICLPPRCAWPVALLVAVGAYVATVTIPGWDADRGILFGAIAAALAIWGIGQAISRNIEVLAVREENARLALEDERNRFARDLHDILGHSLTVITVKAELAQRLFDADPERARTEVHDLERLSRDALADVRRAVEGYRELTLPGELAHARTALAAAEIEAELPNSVDDVPSDRRELFAWAIREGVTNVIRHSHATRCSVVLHPDRVDIRDDGVGPGSEGGGHGLRGLRERASAMNGTVVTRALDPGFSLSVVLP